MTEITQCHASNATGPFPEADVMSSSGCMMGNAPPVGTSMRVIAHVSGAMGVCGKADSTGGIATVSVPFAETRLRLNEGLWAAALGRRRGLPWRNSPAVPCPGE